MGQRTTASWSACSTSRRVNQARGRTAEAVAYLDRSLTIAEDDLRSVLAFSSEPAMYAYLNKLSRMVPMMINLAAAGADDAGVAAALTWNLRLRGITLETLCRYRDAQRLVAPDNPLAGRVSRFHLVKQLLANAALTPPVGLTPKQVAEQTARWRREADDLEAESNRALSKDQHGPAASAAPVDVPAVRRCLAADAALVEFCRVPIFDFKKSCWLEGDHYFAFVLTPGTCRPRLVDLGDAGAIDAAVESLRKEFPELADKLKECDSAAEAREVEKKSEAQFQKKALRSPNGSLGRSAPGWARPGSSISLPTAVSTGCRSRRWSMPTAST